MRALVKYGVSVLVMFGIAWMPLVGAFGYEAALASALAGLVFVPIWSPKKAELTWPSLLLTLGSSVGFWLSAMAVMALVALMRGEMCDLGQGLAYQCLIALPGLVLAGLVWGWISRVSSFAAVRVIVYIAAVSLDLGFAMFALYNWPPLVAFGQFFGYFAGSIYDEAMDVTRALLMFRTGTVLLIACMFASQMPKTGAIRRFVLPVVGLGLACGMHVWLSAAGFLMPMGRDAVSEALWETVAPQDGAFRVHFIPRSKARAALDAQKSRLLRDYSRDYRYLEKFFATRPDAPDGIDIWLYPTAQDKGRFIGAERTSFARIWKNELHLVESPPDSTLARHEMAHLFAGAFGVGPLKVAGGHGIPAIGWIEGFAMAAEWPVQTYDLHTWSEAILSRQDVFGVITPKRLIYGFWGMPSRVAYTLAGSWVRYLIDEYGIERVKLLSQGTPGDFLSVVGVPVSDAFDAWKGELRVRHRSNQVRQIVTLTFGASSIWSRHCARVSASESARWYDCLGDRGCPIGTLEPAVCREGGEIAERVATLEKLYSYYLMRGALDRDQVVPEAVRVLAASQPVLGETFREAWRRMNRMHEVPKNLEEYSASALRERIWRELDALSGADGLPEAFGVIWAERRADMMYHSGMSYIAHLMYRALLMRPLPEAYARRVEIKRDATAVPGSAACRAVRSWLFEPGETSHARIAADYPELASIAYLEFVEAMYDSDFVGARRALGRLVWNVFVLRDKAGTFGPRAWHETLRWMPYL
ncbi:MAG: hypothetical protein IKY83_02295 [Proteobacteria bacterium]|nr:hypothetical protein [Pseudomonadota bacterium]